jgi:hypothetical protein
MCLTGLYQEHPATWGFLSNEGYYGGTSVVSITTGDNSSFVASDSSGNDRFHRLINGQTCFSPEQSNIPWTLNFLGMGKPSWSM